MRLKVLCNESECSASGVSEITADVRKSMEQTFTGYVLPHRTGHRARFSDDDCAMYVPLRQWDAKVPKPKDIESDEFLYEELMDGYFWGAGKFKDYYDKRKIIFVTGSVGSGKSTYVDYFLRCYCPNVSGKKGLFKEKIILHLDLKGAMTAADLDLRIWSELANSLVRAKIPTREIGELGSKVDPTKAKILYALQDVTEYLNNKMNGGKHYLVLVFDNIDQSPIDCQKRCLSFITDILDDQSKIDVWKVIFPMWPETLNRLAMKSTFAQKGVEHHEIDLGKIDLAMFYHKRRQELEEKIGSEHSEGGRRILEEVQALTEKRYADNLRDITYGNMVTLDKMVMDLLLSEEVQMHQEHTNHRPFSDYRFYDSLVCGPFQYHNRKKSSILNPFYFRNNVSEASHIFVVPYLMSYLSHHNEISKNEIVEYFGAFGFRTSLVLEAINCLEANNLLHIEGSELVNPHRGSLDAYRNLILEPAVIDNFAHTTPVPEGYLTKQWVKTKGYDPSHFVNRCLTTVLFLEAMVSMENMIDSEIEGRGMSVGEFREDVDRWARNAWSEYRKRLVALRDLGWPVKARVTDSEWDKILR